MFLKLDVDTVEVVLVPGFPSDLLPEEVEDKVVDLKLQSMISENA